MSKSQPYPVQQPTQQQPPYPPQPGKSQHTTAIVFIIICLIQGILLSQQAMVYHHLVSSHFTIHTISMFFPAQPGYPGYPPVQQPPPSYTQPPQAQPAPVSSLSNMLSDHQFMITIC